MYHKKTCYSFHCFSSPPRAWDYTHCWVIFALVSVYTVAELLLYLVHLLRCSVSHLFCIPVSLFYCSCSLLGLTLQSIYGVTMVVEQQCSELQNFVIVAHYLPCLHCSSRSLFAVVMLISDFCVFLCVQGICIQFILTYLVRVNLNSISISPYLCRIVLCNRPTWLLSLLCIFISILECYTDQIKLCYFCKMNRYDYDFPGLGCIA